MLELPYLSEERLEKLGVPLGPRIRQDKKRVFNKILKETLSQIFFSVRFFRHMVLFELSVIGLKTAQLNKKLSFMLDSILCKIGDCIPEDNLNFCIS
jgi:hypothetical protein